MGGNSDKPFSGNLHQQLTLDLNADVVEWSPANSGERSAYLATGTYQLNEEAGVREGRLYLYRLEGNIARNSQLSLVCLAQHSLPGIFDITWLDSEQSSQLALALADGSLQLFGVSGTLMHNMSELSCISRCLVGEGGDMVLSINSMQNPPNNPSLAYSKSSGAIGIAHITPQGLYNALSWNGHALEAWYVCWDSTNPNVLYSGGDDCVFCAWDVRVPVSPVSPVWKDSRSHGAGVCCISPSPMHSHIVCSGSYDDTVRMWDVRMAAKPVQIAHLGSGGGVWRLKWHPNNPDRLLAACMYAGFAILEAKPHPDGDGPAGLQLVERYPHQAGLAYGADWCPQIGEDGTTVAATCTFYDRSLHLWSYNDPERLDSTQGPDG